MNELVVIYALYPNIVLSVTAVNGEIFRVYPGDGAGRLDDVPPERVAHRTSPTTRHARGAEEIFEYAHHTVRDEDYVLATAVQANLASGAATHRAVRPQRARPAPPTRHSLTELAALATA